jgi:hypothetical protein
MGAWLLVFSAAFVGGVAAILLVNYMAPWGSDR